EELLLARRLASDVRGGTDEARGSADDLLASARRRLAYWDVPASEIAAIERTGQVRRTVTLRAPVGGYVLEKNVLAGQKIMAGEALYRVADLSVIWIEGEVFEQDLAAVRVGQMVHADLQALPNEHRMGRITHIYPTLNPETRTARIRVELANPGLALKPGMYATIRIEGTSRQNVTTIPRSAVLVTGERNLVFVKEGDGRLVPRDIRLGMVNDDRVEVIAGLRAGETVVSSATFLIDAESNLGSALGGMSGASPMPAPSAAAPAAPLPAATSAPADPHAGHTMPED
ncbi:MAG TPA: efflux RND transporter periplasmic adaptor subunit, partial [Gemmatimonadaceae bacterium]|nr:efflux RND transporter periplasmic adaptor subunit [Gemmatimonadaceae bacterium]